MMQIGDLASKAKVTTRTIRYYEELGLIAPEERTEGGFRLYSEDQLRRLHIVQNLKTLGFDLERISAIFRLKDHADTGGELAQAMIACLVEQQEEIDRKIECYRQMQERNNRAIEVLRGCRGCSIPVLERDCHQCQVYQQHPEVPDVIECAIYKGCPKS
jgi:DNA-binding transcriptional MerR regulator